MSRQKTLVNISSELISLFAILDSWCDKTDKFLHEKTETKSPFESLVFVLAVNEVMLSSIQTDITSSDRHSCDDSYQNLSAIVKGERFDELVRNISKYSAAQIRGLLREQLYRFLCMIDHFNDKIVGHSDPSVNDNYIKSSDGVQLIVSNMLNEISLHEEALIP